MIASSSSAGDHFQTRINEGYSTGEACYPSHHTSDGSKNFSIPDCELHLDRSVFTVLVHSLVASVDYLLN